MKKCTFLLSCLAALFLSVTFTACNDDKNSPALDAFAAFATLQSQSDDGAVFIISEEGDSPIVTLTTNRKLQEGLLKNGERCIIYYTNESGKKFQSGTIELLGVSPVFSSSVEFKSKEEIERMFDAPYNLDGIERTRTYVNAVITAPGADARTIALYVDEATRDNDVPEAYLVFVPAGESPAESTYNASFDIAPVWNIASCKGLNIHYQTYSENKNVIYTKTIQITPQQ